MKDKSGFSLVELLITVAIVGLLFSVTIFYVNNVINDSNDKTVKVSNENIKKSARAYSREYDENVIWKTIEITNDNGEEIIQEQGCVLISDLINSGYLKEKDLINTDINKDAGVLLTRDENKTIIKEEFNEEICASIGRKVKVPTSKEICIKQTYDGNTKTIAGSTDERFEILNPSGRDAGEYNIKLKLVSDNYVWKDNATEDKIIVCTIEKAEPELDVTPDYFQPEQLQVGNITKIGFYSNVSGTVSLKNSADDYVVGQIDDNIVSANTKKTVKIKLLAVRENAESKVTVNFVPNDKKNYKNGSVVIQVDSVTRKEIEKPDPSKLCANPVYTGEELSLVNSVRQTGYKFYNTTGVNACENCYKVTAKLDYGYIWKDKDANGNKVNSLEDQVIYCSIKKATPNLNFEPKKISLIKTTSSSIFVTPKNPENSKIKVVPGSITSVASTDTNYVTIDSFTKTEITKAKSAKVTVNGKEVTSNDVKVKVNFTPKDTNNYNSVEQSFNVKVTTNIFKLTYDNNGGSGCTSQNVTYNKTYGNLCTPSKSGYIFVGWFNSNYKSAPLNYYANYYSDLKKAFGYDVNGLYGHWINHGSVEKRRIAEYLSTDTVKITKDTTVYAGWVRKKYARRTYVSKTCTSNCLYYKSVCVGGQNPDYCWKTGINTCIKVEGGTVGANGLCCIPQGYNSCLYTKYVCQSGTYNCSYWGGWSGYTHDSCTPVAGSVECSMIYTY